MEKKTALSPLTKGGVGGYIFLIKYANKSTFNTNTIAPDIQRSTLYIKEFTCLPITFLEDVRYICMTIVIGS
jgi:hypothetical protein